jgi:hypothetical protein
MGDLLLSQSFPAVGRDVAAYMEILEKAVDVFPENTMFISGHGKDCTMKALKDYQKMLLSTIEIVKKGRKAGKSIRDMQKENVLKDCESYNTFLDWLNTDYWIDAVYKSRENQPSVKNP